MKPCGILAFASLTLTLALTANDVFAGTTYRVTSTDGKKTLSYEVSFGGAKSFDRLTAFDPKSKKFVYLDFPRGSTGPEAAGAIWDHRTGETLSLYKFPGVDHPLPAIPAVEDLKVCPFTGAKNLKIEVKEIYD